VDGALRDLASLELADFVACLGQRFRLDADGTMLELALMSADALGAAPSADSRRHPFSLVFRGPHAHALPQRIHRLESARLGVLEIFLVPIEPDAVGRRYEAVFA
jgi:hypothetical protein